MPESDPIKQNCASEVCCVPEGEGLTVGAAAIIPPASQKAIKALADIIRAHAPHISEKHALEASEGVLAEFELAPRGTLMPLKREIVRLYEAGSPE